MFIKRGIAVSPGIAIGPSFVTGMNVFRVSSSPIRKSEVGKELDKLDNALNTVEGEIVKDEQLATDRLGKHIGAIFGAHIAMLRDPQLLSEAKEIISQKLHKAEYACRKVLNEYAKKFSALGNQYFAERANDILDLEKRILRHLMGSSSTSLSQIMGPTIVLAHNLTPSETANLDRNFVKGFATEVGGHTSHTAILAGALEIPAVVGIGNFLSDIHNGDQVIIDGDEGNLIINPDEATLEEYRERLELGKLKAVDRERLRSLTAETQDGERIHLMSNIELPEEIEHASVRESDGIGLYRTEFLYLGKDVCPTEEEHFAAYDKVADAMQGKPVIIRTLDLGADKLPGDLEDLYPEDGNPALGLRSIRLSLHDLDMFRVQLRAILRAAVDRDIRIMFPLVSSLSELRLAKMTVREVMEDLSDQGVAYNQDVKIGIMIEVPAAAIMIELFIKEVDFCSVGTNDLIQYALAVDRSDPAVAKWFSSGDPAIIRLLKIVIDAGIKHNKQISICGQVSSDPKFLPLLIGLGYRHLSIAPHAIGRVKQVIRNLTINKAEEIAEKVLTIDLARNVESYLLREYYVINPEFDR